MANSAEYFRSSILVKNGIAVMPNANWNATTSQKPRSGHNSGFQTNFNSLAVNAFQDQTSSKTAAPISRTASDHGSTAPCASTAKATKTHIPGRMELIV